MGTCFFIPSDILFAEQMSIERNNSVVVIFRHLLPLLPNLYFFMSCSGLLFFLSCSGLIFLYVMFGLAFFYVMFSLLFFMSCSGLSRTSKKHKALAHDMHAESNALRQRFVPQPVLRSSWLQLARFNKDSCRSH